MSVDDRARRWSHSCSGPDAFAALEFAPENADALRECVRAIGLPGFTLAVVKGPMSSQFAGTITVDELDVYAESLRAERIHGNYRGGGENIWIYRVVMVGASRVWFEDGFMAPSPDLMVSEVNLMECLARETRVNLKRWAIMSGGQGYGVEVVAKGEDGASLLTYLSSATDD